MGDNKKRPDLSDLSDLLIPASKAAKLPTKGVRKDRRVHTAAKILLEWIDTAIRRDGGDVDNDKIGNISFLERSAVAHLMRQWDKDLGSCPCSEALDLALKVVEKKRPGRYSVYSVHESPKDSGKREVRWERIYITWPVAALK